MPYTKITGAWVDGAALPVDQAGRLLRSLLNTADMVALVISDGHSAPHSVTVCGIPARHLADLVTEPDDAVSERVTGRASGSAGGA
jgi:hypothetical protein